MALIEHVILLKQDLSTSDLALELKNHEDILGELNGSVIYKESWGLRNLAYPIKENKKAFYEFMNIEIPNENIDNLNAKLNLNENVIRYLSIKVKSFCDTPTVMLKDKE
jgi:small subunit ribosomal protein S6|tara:strand:- start:897 stop:1223 length:327 start_codon:yes stop_codon:yes gene_type:complete